MTRGQVEAGDTLDLAGGVHQWMRTAPYLAFFLSGTSSLIFQLIWSRLLHHVFGSSTVAISSVVSVFMGGLALGAWLFSRFADRVRSPIVLYAVAEVGVGLCGLAVPWLLRPEGWLATVNAWLHEGLGVGSTGFMIARFACLIPVLIVPTTLMGSTLPLLARHFVGGHDDPSGASARVGALYAINTIGAVAGIFLAGFVLLPEVGVTRTNLIACSLNFALALFILAFRKSMRPGSRQLARPAPVDPAHQERIPRVTRVVAAAVFALSGFASLLYEVVWSRALINAIGGSVYAFALILMTFLIGISSGSAVASLLVDLRRRVLWPLGASALVLCAIANAPLALVVRDGPPQTGALLVRWSSGMLVCAGVIAALCFIGSRQQRLDAVLGSVEERARGERRWASSVLGIPLVCAALLATLFAGRLAYICLAVVGSLTAFALVVLWLRRRVIVLLAAMQLFIALATFVSGLWADEISLTFAGLVAPFYEQLPQHVDLVLFLMFVTSGLCVLPAAMGMGAMFPLTMRVWSAGGEHIGRDVGVVYTGNTVGSILGAWLPGFILMPWFGMQGTLHIGVGIGLVLCMTLLLCPKRERPAESTRPATRLSVGDMVAYYLLPPVVPALLTLLYVLTSQPGSFLRWDLTTMTLGAFRISLAKEVVDQESWGRPELIYYRDGLATTVTVERWGRHLALKNNGKVDASNGDDMPTQIMVAALPLLLHRQGIEDHDVAIVGFGSGVTVGTALRFPVKHVDVIELERATVEASRFFADVNHLRYVSDEYPFVEMPRLTLINDDGRNYLASTPKRFDIIVNEPSNPWLTGVSDLFTKDHFALTKRRLKPGGVYCQWVQLYELSPENVKVIYRTFASQFRYAAVFSAEDLSSDTLMIGSDAPLSFDLRRVRGALAAPEIGAELERAYVHSAHDVFARVLLASKEEILEYAQLEYRRPSERAAWVPHLDSTNHDPCQRPLCRREPVALNTDDNALIEFSAPRDLIGFQRYAGYLDTIYGHDWPYGRLLGRVSGFGNGAEAASNHAQQALALVAHGRKREARAFLRRARELGPPPSSRRTVDMVSLLLSEQPAPVPEFAPPLPGPELSAAAAAEVKRAFRRTIRALDGDDPARALAAIGEVPAPLWAHTDPELRFLHGYALYRGHDCQAAIDELEELTREHNRYVSAHPQVYYFLACCHDALQHFDKAVRNMRLYVEGREGAAAETVAASGADLDPSPPRE